MDCDARTLIVILYADLLYLLAFVDSLLWSGPEVLLPDPRPPVFRHGVRKRRRGEKVHWLSSHFEKRSLTLFFHFYFLSIQGQHCGRKKREKNGTILLCGFALVPVLKKLSRGVVLHWSQC